MTLKGAPCHLPETHKLMAARLGLWVPEHQLLSGAQTPLNPSWLQPVAHPPPCFSASWLRSRVNARPGAGWGHTGSRWYECQLAYGWHSPGDWSAAQRAVPRIRTLAALRYPPADKGQVTHVLKASQPLSIDFGSLWLWRGRPLAGLTPGPRMALSRWGSVGTPMLSVGSHIKCLGDPGKNLHHNWSRALWRRAF